MKQLASFYSRAFDKTVWESNLRGYWGQYHYRQIILDVSSPHTELWLELYSSLKIIKRDDTPSFDTLFDDLSVTIVLLHRSCSVAVPFLGHSGAPPGRPSGVLRAGSLAHMRPRRNEFEVK